MISANEMDNRFHDWDFVDQLRDSTSMKLLLKGIVTADDAELAIGRPYIWGLSSFGQEGVEMVLDILTRELAIVMRQAGTQSIADIDRSRVI